MVKHPVRTYQVINPGPTRGPIVFTADAPAGAVRTVRVGGDRVRVVLDGYELRPGIYAAERVDIYL